MFAEVLALAEGESVWRTVDRWEDPGRMLEKSFSLHVATTTTLYLRTELREPVNGRAARAWSSPIRLHP